MGTALLALGAALLAANLIGFFFFTEIDADDWYVLDVRPRSVTVGEFWRRAERRPDESTESFVRRLTELISDRFLLIDSRNARPTFFENWLLWARARSRGRHEWIDSARAVRLGGGFCSQHAIVLDNILEEEGIESRILALSGHVVNEVRIDRAWRVCDPDYGVVFDCSLDELERSPETVFRAYRAAGLSVDEARRWRAVFTSAEDNTPFPSATAYRPGDALFERAALRLVWVVPLALLVLGGLMRRP